jgi:predicted  nucleic acid-binding Zn-ribbon protein
LATTLALDEDETEVENKQRQTNQNNSYDPRDDIDVGDDSGLMPSSEQPANEEVEQDAAGPSNNGSISQQRHQSVTSSVAPSGDYTKTLEILERQKKDVVKKSDEQEITIDEAAKIVCAIESEIQNTRDKQARARYAQQTQASVNRRGTHKIDRDPDYAATTYHRANQKSRENIRSPPPIERPVVSPPRDNGGTATARLEVLENIEQIDMRRREPLQEKRPPRERLKWTEAELQALEDGMSELQCQWAKISNAYRDVLFRRTQVDLKDKVRYPSLISGFRWSLIMFDVVFFYRSTTGPCGESTPREAWRTTRSVCPCWCKKAIRTADAS